MSYDISPELWRITKEKIFDKLKRLEKNHDIMGIEISPIKNRKSVTIELKLKRKKKENKKQKEYKKIQQEHKRIFNLAQAAFKTGRAKIKT